ncbi:hypothetical protein [Cellulomonas sp. Y8]|uniref:hypothetical protein n=1 Tax=Cellulomonas sp. Y8 TaxID=2591145 RepID=UPI0011CC318C|nr:hypothetical protein [Cellulomonas sp. Y8]
MRSPARWWVVAALIVVLVAGGVVAALVLLRAAPALLDADDIAGVSSVAQDADADPAPGWVWCDTIAPSMWERGEPPTTSLVLDDGSTIGATLIERPLGGLTAGKVLSNASAAAESCGASHLVDEGFAIEPLSGLADGEVGWRSARPDGRWGEYVLVDLDGRRVLAVGFETEADEAPLPIGDLVALAREGAERFPGDG